MRLSSTWRTHRNAVNQRPSKLNNTSIPMESRLPQPLHRLFLSKAHNFLPSTVLPLEWV